MSKSYVTLALCPICQKENGSILMDRRLKESFEMHTIDPTGVCDTCRKKYLTRGVLMINPKTCSLVVIKNAAFKRMFDTKLPKHKIAFCDEEVLEKLQSRT